MVGRDRPAHRCHDLTTLPHTAQPEDLEVEEPAPAGSSPTPTLRASSRSTGITDDESSPVDQGSAYAASKGALVAAVRSWATELAPRMIRVNTLVPGAIDTDFRRFLDPARRDAFEGAVSAATPLRRPGTPDEAAAVALFLLSDDASYVTGSQYAVDGGLTLV